MYADVFDSWHGSPSVSVPPERAPKGPSVIGPYGPIIAGAVLGAAGSAWSARKMAQEAQKDRDFQERMSSTALQRSTQDALLAGINPIFLAGRGASSPGGSTADVPDFGEGVSRGVASALAVRQAKAQIALTEAQGRREDASAAFTRTQDFDLQTQAASGRYEIIRNQVLSGELDLEQRRSLLPLLVDRAAAEVADVRAAALLKQYAAEGAANVADFEKRFGEAGPWVRLFFEFLRSAK